ncbi:AbrB/MazE/SpoVT family DNA-binding domain-containing protein [uncultured Desulfobacter sp.]|uniref:AbrB/MazE/SpoVT family DNA-binding domain-containing protein n=2 Tax=Desulfobacter TaxID=2289 RepID=UPI0029F55716|nr:AbrB/MazE/SpoVT family DNA-binding domain-containing protein [uncultured Desulfobacter sp.]
MSEKIFIFERVYTLLTHPLLRHNIVNTMFQLSREDEMTELVIKKWGNSLAARIPKVIADMVQLEKDQPVTIEAKGGRIIITPIQKRKEYTLDELLDQCDPKDVALDAEDRSWLNDKPVGKEW